MNNKNKYKFWNSIWFQRILVIILFLFMWEILAQFRIIDKFYTSYPTAIYIKSLNWLYNGYILSHLFVTAYETFIGFFIGLIAGISTAMVFANSDKLTKLFSPIMSLFNAMPRIVFAPIIVLWFGLGLLSKVVMVLLMVYFIIFFNTLRGIKEVDISIVRNAQILGATNKQLWQHVYFPSALTWIFTSLRISVGFSIVGAIIGEYIGSSKGIGYVIETAQANFDSTGVMSGLLLLAVLVGVLDYGLQLSEAIFAKWKIQT